MKGGELFMEFTETNRRSYIEAIMKLLEQANPRKLRLVWVYASKLIR